MNPNTEHPTTESVTTGTTHADPSARPLPVHIYVLLDRSGSMAAIHGETVAGFNAFLAGQQASGDDARLTLVQFDSEDPAEVLIDDVPIARVSPLRLHQFQPRGATPLLDATGALIGRARTRSEVRWAEDRPEKVLMVTITDGLENASVELTRPALRSIVAERERDGWIFVFLSAGLDAYEEARSFGYSDGSVQAWAPDAAGAGLAFGSLSDAVVDLRLKVRQSAPVDARQVFAGSKPAEADRRRKRGDSR